MRQIVTDKDVKESGLKREVYQDFIDVMQGLWEASIFLYKIEGEKVFPKQCENEIHLGKLFTLTPSIVNGEFVEILLVNNETEFVKVRYWGDVTSVAKCVFSVVKDLIAIVK